MIVLDSSFLIAYHNTRDPNSAFFLDTFETFRGLSSQGLSFVDAAIVTIARKRDAQHVLTFDSDFEGIDGLTVLPEPRLTGS